MRASRYNQVLSGPRSLHRGGELPICGSGMRLGCALKRRQLLLLSVGKSCSRRFHAELRLALLLSVPLERSWEQRAELWLG